MTNYAQKQQQFQLFPPPTQFGLGIYGKSFFVQVVLPVLNRLFGQHSEKQWRSELYIEHMPAQCPADIQPILAELLNF